jgi:dihydroxyacetone kinase-like protein
VPVSYGQVSDWIRAFAAVVAENKEYLTELDSAIGDADHGINMNRGMQAVVGKLDAGEAADIGALLKTVGMTLVSTVGGASGPLRRSAEAAQAAMTATIPLVARKGRASYLGERSANHQDPGSTSSWLLLRTAAETFTAKDG